MKTRPEDQAREHRLRIEAWILGLFVVGGYVSLGLGFWQRLLVSLPNRDQELLALALSIELQHGADGPRVIAEKIGAFALAGESGAIELWREVARRYDKFISQGAVTN